MKIKFTKNGFEFEGEINQLDELNEFSRLVKNTMYQLSDNNIQESFKHYDKALKKNNQSVEPTDEVELPEFHPATPKQIDYLVRGWSYQGDTTKLSYEEADSLIKAYKAKWNSSKN